MTDILKIAVLLLLLGAPATGQVLRFSAGTERTRIAMGEQAVVVATLVTAKQIPGLAIPPAAGEGFSLLKSQSQQSSSSSIQIINGKASQKNEITTQFYYVIAPRQTGTFTFPALSLTIDGTPYQTEPISFTVSNEAVSNPDVRVFLTLSKRTLYPGEQAQLAFKVAQRAQAQGSSDVRNGFNGSLEAIERAIGKSFTLTRLFTNQVASASERIDGEMYNTFSLNFLLFPLTAGSYHISGVPFEYQELHRASRRGGNPFFDDFFGGDFFGGGVQAVPKTAITAPLTIEVKPFPLPQPAGFSGAVGSFSLQATADPVTVAAGEAVTLKVMLRGSTRPGSMGDVSVPQRDDYELFSPEKQISVDTGETGFVTRKMYKYLLIPKNEGTLTLDPVVFRYFDPKTGSYATATSDQITLTVTKGLGGKKEQQTRYLTQEEIREVGRDIRYIKTNVALKNESRYPYRDPVFLLLFPLPFIGIILAILYRFQATHRERNEARQSRNRALANALKKISFIKKQVQTLSPDDFLGRIASVIEDYISQKFGFAATGRTLEELNTELLQSNADQTTVTELARFIEQLDGYRFGGISLDSGSRLSVIERATAFLTGLERGARKEKS